MKDELSFYSLVSIEVPQLPKPPTPRANGEATGCIDWIEAVEGIDCDVMVSDILLSMEVFYQLNPSVKSDCTGLSLGTNYCVSTRKLGIHAPDDSDEEEPIPTTSKPAATNAPTPTPVQVSVTNHVVFSS